MGDFNTYNGEDEIADLLKKTHLKDRHKLNHKSNNDSLEFTQPAWHPMRRLDYVLVSSQIKVLTYNVLNFVFSDHLPLYLEFDVV